MSLAPQQFVAQVKARLLPLSAVERTLEMLLERLPRRLVEVVLEPVGDLETIDANLGKYRATGDAPRFTMRLVNRHALGGWYYLEAALVRHTGSREASIQVTTNAPDPITIPIPTNLRGTVREVVFIPHQATALYWLPTAAPGYFSQSPLLLHKISALESVLRRLHRVAFDLWRFRGKRPETRAGLTLWEALADLQGGYQRTAQIRVKRLQGFDYSNFIALNERSGKADVAAMHKQISQWPGQPLLSFILVLEPSATPEALKSLFDSLVAQLYQHYEVVVVGDLTGQAQLAEIVGAYQHQHMPLNLLSVAADTSLATKLNIALAEARGTWVGRLHTTDRLPWNALFYLAKEINAYPQAELIYSDEDGLDARGQRINPRFKPDWNPELFVSTYYIAKLTLYKLQRAIAVGGYHEGFDGAEGYDLALRYLKDVPGDRVRHIAKVLCHSYPSAIDPSQSHLSGVRALTAYFAGTGVKVADGAAAGLYRIHHPLPASLPLVSIIIPTRDHLEILRNCLDSLLEKTTYANWEILVVDNQSVAVETLVYFKHIQENPRIKVLLYDQPFNYSALNNFAALAAKGEILALLNNDVEVISPDWLDEMVAYALRPEVGAVGAKLFYANGLVQHAGVILGLGGVAGHAHKFLGRNEPGYCARAVVAQNLSAVTGACLVVRKASFFAVGGLDEANLVVAFNDIDFCLKLLAAGYRNVFTPYAQLYHHESLSRGHDDTPEKQALFLQEFHVMRNRWGIMLQHDSAYNANLTLEFEDFSLRSAGQRQEI